MILTERKKPKELLYLEALSARTALSNDETKKLEWLSRGYQGEVLYDKIVDEVGLSNIYIFRDIYLEIDGSVTQFDCLIVTEDAVEMNEVKNYSGNYACKNGKWYVRDVEVSDNPLIQMSRAESKLIKLRNAHNLRFNVGGKIVFSNIEFVLTSDDSNLSNSIITRPYLRSYLREFKNSWAGPGAESIVRLIQSYIVENPYFKSVADFDQVRKGLYCRDCACFDLDKRQFHYSCTHCGKLDTVHTLVLRAIADYSILFSDRPLTRKSLWEFLNYEISERTLIRFLLKYCNQYSDGRSRHYKFKYYDFDAALKEEARLWRYMDH